MSKFRVWREFLGGKKSEFWGWKVIIVRGKKWEFWERKPAYWGKTDKISNQGRSPLFRRFPLRYLDIVTLFVSQVLNHVLFCFCHVWSSPVCLLSPSSSTHSSSAPANDHTPWWCHFLPFSLWQTEHQILFWTLNTPECAGPIRKQLSALFSFQLFLTFTDYLRWATWWCQSKV